jgi:Calpain family cysteine protease
VEARGEAREPTTSALSITLRDCGATPTSLATAAQHLLVVPKPVAHAVRLADIHFGTSRAVVLPTLPQGTPRGQPTPLDTIAAAIAHMATAEPRPFDEVGWENDGVTRSDLAGFDLMTYADPEHDFVKKVARIRTNAQKKIKASPRKVFVNEAAPSMAPMRCRQGMMGDCFFLAPLICLAHRSPEQLLAMIGKHPERIGQWQVQFPRSERPISLDAPTDAEIALFSSADGLWSVMFEMAYGVEVYRDRYGALTKLEVNADGGPIEAAIGVLTGNPVEVLDIDGLVMGEIGGHLEDAMARGAIVAAGTKATRDGVQYTPNGLVRSHAYSILDYRDGVAVVRNPWGGTTGGIEGQAMKDGVFEMPLPFLAANFRKICIEQ